MIQIDLPTLVKRLNLFSRQALEMAASECMSQQAAEITVSHVLIQMLAMPRSDLRVITRQGDIGMEELRQALTVENYTTARSADSYPAFSPMLVEWLKEGWLLASAEMQHSELRGGLLLLALLHSPLRYIPPAAARLLTGINRDRLQQDFVQWTQESAESVVPDADGKGAGTMTHASDTLLARYAKNMTADARNGRLDPVLCRDHEIDLMIDILCRRRKNNPVVVGEAGVGKSALIEGLALRIVAGQVPGERPTVVITTPAIGHVPPRPVLMFSCVDNITRMQVALMHPLDVHDIAVTLNADNRALRSHWFVRENGTLLESSRGLSGIDEIKQLFGAKTLTVDTGADNAAGKLTFNIDGLARAIAPLRDACHWAGE